MASPPTGEPTSGDLPGGPNVILRVVDDASLISSSHGITCNPVSDHNHISSSFHGDEPRKFGTKGTFSFQIVRLKPKVDMPMSQITNTRQEGLLTFLSYSMITMSLDISGVALKYTTASLGAAISNTLPVITFFFAVLFRMEKVKLRTSPGIMKVSGVALCLAGAATIALYRGPFLKLLLHHHLIKSHHQQLVGHAISSSQTWIKGVSLMLLAYITWALWLVLQGRVLKSYPSKFLLTTLQCFLSTIQAFFVAVAFVRDPNEWKLGWDIKLISIAYCGIVVTGISFYLQAWVIEKKGPVYLAMTTPLILIFTTFASTFLFGEIITLGRSLPLVHIPRFTTRLVKGPLTQIPMNGNLDGT
ncbi:WAT1-related protein [Forsythia ovata]|uniref:WAT1-related protein n=1 Tax=Forsythia ovata TaxID=205694 RepID=A0ABD1WP81_9LAMI